MWEGRGIPAGVGGRGGALFLPPEDPRAAALAANVQCEPHIRIHLRAARILLGLHFCVSLPQVEARMFVEVVCGHRVPTQAHHPAVVGPGAKHQSAVGAFRSLDALKVASEPDALARDVRDCSIGSDAGQRRGEEFRGVDCAVGDDIGGPQMFDVHRDWVVVPDSGAPSVPGQVRVVPTHASHHSNLYLPGGGVNVPD